MISRIGDVIQRALGRSDVSIDNALFMRRWKLIAKRWGGARLHNFLRSDADVELHDHPFDFVTFILWGGYWEVTIGVEGDAGRLGFIPLTRRWHGPGSILYRRATDLHRVELEPGKTAWTFVLRGPDRHDWGFLTERGWTPWRTFIARKRNRNPITKWAADSSY